MGRVPPGTDPQDMHKRTYRPFPELHVLGAFLLVPLLALAGGWLLVASAFTYCNDASAQDRWDVVAVFLGSCLLPLGWAGLCHLTRTNPKPWLIVSGGWLLLATWFGGSALDRCF
jgi:hypothetical protein